MSMSKSMTNDPGDTNGERTLIMGLRWLRAGLCVALLLGPSQVWAHAQLDHSDPAVGSHVAKSPAKVTIWFTEALESPFSSIVVKDATGATVQVGKAALAPDNTAQLQVDLKPLKAGTYTVHWRVLSVDTHRSQGEFNFEVDP